MTRPPWLKSFLIGFSGALLAILTASALWTAWVTYQRAILGAMAYDAIIRYQQQQGRGASPPGAK